MTGRLYEVLLNIHADLAELTADIERLIFSSPRAAMQTTRTMAETLAGHVAEMENIESRELNFAELLMKLKAEGILTPSADQAFQFVRRNGNIASHDGTRKMLILEALTCWEYQHLILAWYIETYASPNINMPSNVEPAPPQKEEETAAIIQHIQELMERLGKKGNAGSRPSMPSDTVREICYRDRCVSVPYFCGMPFYYPSVFRNQ